MTTNIIQQWNVYKGSKGKMGAFQFQLGKPREVSGKSRPGAVFIDAAPADPNKPDTYTWSKKIQFALGTDDIGKVVDFVETIMTARTMVAALGPLLNAKPEALDQSPILGPVRKQEAKLSLYHDKDKGTANEGKEAKRFVVIPLKNLNSFGITLSDAARGGTSVFIPLSASETTTFINLLRHAQAAALGWIS
jgi:hypothetical protein